MPANARARQKKLEKHRKKRERVRRQTRSSQLPSSIAALVRLAADAPFGPIWISAEIDSHTDLPALVTTIVTRRISSGLLLPQIVLVDRTCLGVKNAFVMRPVTEYELVAHLREIEPQIGVLRPCEPFLAQSLVWHAVDYARSLGFEPNVDFEPALLGPRPTALLDTPLARPERPIYVAGPDDDIAAIAQRLEGAVGAENYDIVGLGDDLEWDDEDGDYDDDYDLELISR
jgi:hypothetical protein